VGQFIAIEGGDGSGKGTQTKLLVDYLRSKTNMDVLQLSFPRYGKDSAYYAERYLNGAYGADSNSIDPELASLAYAIDRAGAADEIRAHLDKPNSIVVTDRYVASNFAHQGVKINDINERRKFYERTMTTEYEVLGFPRPTKNIVLLVPADVSQQNVDKKSARVYTDKKRDLHEADKNHLELAKRNYEELCQLYPQEFIALNCMSGGGQMRSIEDIQADIRQIISV